MAKASMALTELVEKGADTDVLRQMIQYVAQRLMDLDVEGLCGAGYGERSADRTNSRNGYRERAWDTRAGTMALRIPKMRAGSYFPALEREEPEQIEQDSDHRAEIVTGSARIDQPLALRTGF
jgi:transposase-like protein